MDLKHVVEALRLEVKTGAALLDREVTGAYAGDLLSDVLAHAREGDLWITLHTHVNIVAVASAREVAGIIIVNGRTPEQETLRKAEEEGVPLLIARGPAFAVACSLYELGITADASV